jgi:hypothetical protein
MTTMRKAVLSTAALISIAAACSDERAITTEPVGAVGYGQNLLRISTNLPRGRVNFTSSPLPLAAAASDTVVIWFAGLDSLTTGSYVWWAANDSATKFARLTGSLRMEGVDTTVNEAGDPVFTPVTAELGTVSEFKNGGPNRRYRFSVLRSQMAGFTATDSVGVILLSVESGTPGAEPSAVRPLWARRSEMSTARLAGLKFGNYKPRRIEQYVYSGSTVALLPTVLTGTVDTTYRNIPRGRVEVRGDVFTVNDSNYFRPPVGYYYKAWAIKTGEFGVFADTFSLGDKASPPPRRVSFRDADVSVPAGAESWFRVSGTPCAPNATECKTQEPVIIASQHRASASALGVPQETGFDLFTWDKVAWTYVTLQNKAAPEDRMGGVVIMSVNHPGSISGL